MMKIEPVAWIMPSAMKALSAEGSAMVGAADQGIDLPLYDQQAIDTLRADYARAEELALQAIEKRKEAEAEADVLRQLCRDMLPVFEAARPLVLNLERLRDATKEQG